MTVTAVRLLLKYRRPLVVVLHLGVGAISHYVAFWLRFDGDIPPEQQLRLVEMFPWLIVIRGLSFIPFRLYEGLWRYASIWDLRNIIGAVFTGSIVFFIAVRWVPGVPGYPRSALLIDTILLIVLLGGLRLGRRVHGSLMRTTGDKRALIYGAGEAGEMIVRNMRNNTAHDYEPIGFVDDDPTKINQRIHGVKVLGTRDDLPRIMTELKPDVVVVALGRSSVATIRGIVRMLEPFKVSIQRLPDLRDLLDGTVTVSQLRTLSIEDLLERAPVGLDREPLRDLLEGRRVLVTGAGGSVGSELCRQIATLAPRVLVALERYENGLYTIANDLTEHAPACAVKAVVADVTNAERMRRVLAEHRPEIVFHAAAHKHVPLMESNPCEAVLNNVRGTRVLVETAGEARVGRVIVISSDKAVNPTSVMGATKRLAELIVQTTGSMSPGIFAAVRFGNVLGSSGSVVPMFVEQIKAGKPLTVTHPEMRRYFMLIKEAIGLLLHAATLAKGGEIYVLDMGEQVSVLDLARNLIRLSGLRPDEDIPIVFTGPRPGEKLYEELVGVGEEVEPSSTEGVLRIRGDQVPEAKELMRRIRDLEHLAEGGDARAVRERLREILPTYRPIEPGS